MPAEVSAVVFDSGPKQSTRVEIFYRLLGHLYIEGRRVETLEPTVNRGPFWTRSVAEAERVHRPLLVEEFERRTDDLSRAMRRRVETMLVLEVEKQAISRWERTTRRRSGALMRGMDQ